jgi:glycosyltransferase involved in cell wall biosynthesis
MRMFLEALQELFEEIEILFYVSPNLAISPATVARYESDLRSHWAVSAKLVLCPYEPTNSNSGYIAHYLLPALSVTRMPDFSRLCGRSQTVAYETCLDRLPSMVFAHRLHSMGPLLRSTKQAPPIFLDLDDIEHITFFRSVRMPPLWRSKALYYLQLPALIGAERRAIKRAEKTFVCSSLDRKYLQGTWRLTRVVTIPNSVTIPSAAMQGGTEDILMFVGYYGYRPNAEAADFLISRVWPLVRSAVPGARLVLVGSAPENISNFASRPSGVEFTGFVADLDKFYRRASVVCCPVLRGGGTRVKILEAAAYGKAIVSTHIGAEGIDLRDGVEIMLRDEAHQIADACIQLLRDRSLCDSLGRAARRIAEDRYDRRCIVNLIKKELTS